MTIKRRNKKPEKKEQERKQLGVLINSVLWTQIKILALQQGRNATEVLEDAMREYLQKHKGKGNK
jgi:hypothetical protein